MSMKDNYKIIIDNAFGRYYELFRKKDALDKEHAVTIEELFGEEAPSSADRQMFKKMVSFGLVRRTGEQYWLDEKKAGNPMAVYRQRMAVIGIAMILVLVYCVLMGDFKF